MKAKAYAKFGLVLAAYAAAACALLAVTQTLTKAAKEKQDAIRTKESLGEIFPDLESFETLADFKPAEPDAAMSVAYAIAVKQKDVVIGVAVAAVGKSYSGNATVLVGVGLDNRIEGVRILELNDTPGLGQKAKAPNYFIDKKTRTTTWFGQFAGKGADAPLEVNKDVVAITAATISSRSLSRIVKYAAANGAAYLSGRAEVSQ